LELGKNEKKILSPLPTSKILPLPLTHAKNGDKQFWK
jgi:hypothetical protein